MRAASLLIAVGDNPERLKSEVSVTLLCGVAPVPASSGKTVRHRLNRGGNREANRALHVVALGRMSWDERTREYVAGRTAESKSKWEILRCLKRYVAREAYRILTAPGTLPSSVSVPRLTQEHPIMLRSSKAVYISASGPAWKDASAYSGGSTVGSAAPTMVRMGEWVDSGIVVHNLAKISEKTMLKSTALSAKSLKLQRSRPRGSSEQASAIR